MGGTLAFYTYTTYMQKYLVNTVGMSISDCGNQEFEVPPAHCEVGPAHAHPFQTH